MCVCLCEASCMGVGKGRGNGPQNGVVLVVIALSQERGKWRQAQGRAGREIQQLAGGQHCSRASLDQPAGGLSQGRG